MEGRPAKLALPINAEYKITVRASPSPSSARIQFALALMRRASANAQCSRCAGHEKEIRGREDRFSQSFVDFFAPQRSGAHNCDSIVGCHSGVVVVGFETVLLPA